MKKRIGTLLLALALLCGLLPLLPTASAASGFEPVNTYEEGMFRDVPSGAWYADAVKTVYEYGLMNGTGNGRFNPKGYITEPEAIALACRIHSLSRGGDGVFPPSQPWYDVYVRYAVEHGLRDKYAGLVTAEGKINRCSFAALIGKATPSSQLSAINQIGDHDIFDLLNIWDDEDESMVYTLYRAGVLTGNNEHGDFGPIDYVTRDAVAAIVARIVKPELRQHFELVPYDITVDDIQGTFGFWQRTEEQWTREFRISGNTYQEGFIMLPDETSDDHLVEYHSGTLRLDGYLLICDVQTMRDWTFTGKFKGRETLKIPVDFFLEGGYQKVSGPLGVVEAARDALEGDYLPMPIKTPRPAHPAPAPEGHSSSRG